MSQPQTATPAAKASLDEKVKQEPLSQEPTPTMSQPTQPTQGTQPTITTQPQTATPGVTRISLDYHPIDDYNPLAALEERARQVGRAKQNPLAQVPNPPTSNVKTNQPAPTPQPNATKPAQENRVQAKPMSEAELACLRIMSC
ncbi:hypothetical protein FRC00_004153, partial [Tulasnella sp. 408]